MTQSDAPQMTLRKRVAASAPAVVTAIVYAWPLLFKEQYFPWTDRVSLGRAMQIEFIAMASGLFLLWPLLMFTITSRRGQVVRVLIFLALAWMFAGFAHDYDGWRGVVSYGWLVIVSYGGASLFTRDTLSMNTLALLAAGRWVIWLFLFFGLVVYFDLGEGNIGRWDGKLATVQLGATFFTIMFLLEFFVISRVGHVAEGWLRRQRKTGRAPAPKDAPLEPHLEARARFYRRLQGK